MTDDELFSPSTRIHRSRRRSSPRTFTDDDPYTRTSLAPERRPHQPPHPRSTTPASPSNASLVRTLDRGIDIPDDRITIRD